MSGILLLMNKDAGCPSCGNKQPVCQGKIHEVRGLFKLDEAGDLFSCSRCGLYYRFPYLSEQALKKAYESIDTEGWVYDQRVDNKLAKEIILSSYVQGKVLDVGCYRGDFLKTLPQSYGKFGIEPSPQARQEATGKGIILVSEMIEDLDASTQTFDAITMLDVIEHLPRPVDALKKLTAALKPGGVLIISTGNTDALPWRFMRLNYWYYFPEHVSFFNKKWFVWVSRKLNLEVVSVRSFSHFEKSFFVSFRQLLEAFVYQIASACAKYHFLSQTVCKVYPLSRALTWKQAPKTNTWSDHMIVVLRKA